MIKINTISTIEGSTVPWDIIPSNDVITRIRK
jgi:hypothetical protein